MLVPTAFHNKYISTYQEYYWKYSDEVNVEIVGAWGQTYKVVDNTYPKNESYSKND